MRLAALTMLVVSAAGAPGKAAEAPTVASINVCTDQLALILADPGQILTLSWLAADPEESMRAAEAARYPLNFGTAEELLRYAPEVVLAGSFTGASTRALLDRLGYEVVVVPPAESVDAIADNIRQVAAALGQVERGAALVKAMRNRVARLTSLGRAPGVRTVVVRAGGFTTGAESLADAMLSLAGLVNIPALQGLDRWGSLSMETLLRTEPQLLIMTDYRIGEASLANDVLTHPALEKLRAEVPVAVVPQAQWSCGLPDSLKSVGTMRRAAAAVRGGAGSSDADARTAGSPR